MHASKLYIVLLADAQSHENQGRALHALLYAKQALAAGTEVKIVFDGGGVEWPGKMAQEDSHFHDMYMELVNKGVIDGVCSFCSEAFDVKDELEQLDINLIAEDNGHPNIGTKIAEGWQVITL